MPSKLTIERRTLGKSLSESDATRGFSPVCWRIAEVPADEPQPAKNKATRKTLARFMSCFLADPLPCDELQFNGHGPRRSKPARIGTGLLSISDFRESSWPARYNLGMDDDKLIVAREHWRKRRQIDRIGGAVVSAAG